MVRHENEQRERRHLSITNKVPFAPSSLEKPGRGGSRVTETFCSLWRRTGGMSAKDAGVDALATLCSSEEMKLGKEEASSMGILTSASVDEGKLQTVCPRQDHLGRSPSWILPSARAASASSQGRLGRAPFVLNRHVILIVSTSLDIQSFPGAHGSSHRPPR